MDSTGREDKVLSDVHVGCLVEAISSGRQSTIISRFQLTLKPQTCLRRTLETAEVDDDGDFVVTRCPSSQHQTLIIEHAMETTIPNVGQQVWPGALLLADFILRNPDRFTGCFALELGGGTGLVSIVLAKVARHVICTDIGDDVLQCCQRNIERNSYIYEDNPYGQGCPSQIIEVKELNWLDQDQKANDVGTFTWSSGCLERLHQVEVIIAADVIYADNLTEAFVCTVRRLMLTCHMCSRCYIAIEKRFNFTLADLDTACPAYQHFCSCMEELCQEESPSGVFQVRQIPLDFASSFEFERSSHMELWCVDLCQKRD